MEAVPVVHDNDPGFLLLGLRIKQVFYSVHNVQSPFGSEYIVYKPELRSLLTAANGQPDTPIRGNPVPQMARELVNKPIDGDLVECYAGVTRFAAPLKRHP